MTVFAGSDGTDGVHLIDEDGQILPLRAIQEYLYTALNVPDGSDALHRVGINYHVVGVLGGQSSGKSTLLNCLFCTHFQMMDETKWRGQTTKGAFLARAAFANSGGDDEEAEAAAPAMVGTGADTSWPLFVVDIEGTDGLERGEDQSFERQLSLFALSLADTLIINMWTVDVGRFNAANMSLLRTIFEVNLQLFSHDSYKKEEKPTLLVVLRDFTDEDTTLYFKTVRQSFDKIWDNIVKPEAFQGSSIDVFFDLRYHVLPHFKLQHAAFNQAVATFREWFFLSTCEQYLFHGGGMFRGVPLDGIPAYLSNCWEMIRASKDLDIPTQREMLARHRCMEVKNNIIQLFTENCREYTECFRRGELVPHLTDVLDREIVDQLRAFHTQTQLYKTTIVHSTEVELGEELLKIELNLIGEYAKHIALKVLAGLDTTVSEAVDRTLRWMLHQAQLIPFITTEKGKTDEGEDYALRERSFGEVCSKKPCLVDNEKCHALVHGFWMRLCHVLHAEMELFYRNSNQQPQQQQQVSRLYDRYASLVEEDPALQESVAHALFDAVAQKISRRFTSMAENATETIHQAFESALNRKLDGTVRFFNTTKALQRCEPQARQAGLVFLNCLLYYRMKVVAEKAVFEHGEREHLGRVVCHLLGKRRKLMVRENNAEQHFFLHYTTISEVPRYPTGVLVAETDSADSPDNAVDRECVLLSQQAVQRVFDMYTQKCEFTMQVQLRSIESEKQHLPVWVLPVMLLLGWNELWYVLSSPILLPIVIFVAVIYLRQRLLSQWEIFEETGPTCVVVAVRVVLRHLQTIYDKLVPRATNEVESETPRYRDPGSLSDVAAHAMRTSLPSTAATEPQTASSLAASATLKQ
ncbi:hypothetical protein TraAM80_01018 [Trypanosoma rangeli]|uniref:Protein SEY1 homolog n=1 Tax=Trypanosoma rangeli TaxID=5698 RepID=A0A3R7KQ50_TRYRA|nr:uncharacterized protein TraAM80_01018 [Trypanosoma rangeli]RNF11401.1 hypothetical protein TraAM80_01018 [Trypanosoma rangeli]|eukprot:RNF11401.1 hypothetical protein TraAM80_01018 [Trypanosoma rangeli]